MVDKMAAISPESYPLPYGWLSPRVSISCDLPDDGPLPMALPPPTADRTDPNAVSGGDFIDFEFPLDDPVAMLSADELFFNGKLVPLQISAAKPPAARASSEESASAAIRSLESTMIRRMAEVSISDPYAFSPRAPSCTSRWRELLGLKRAEGSEKLVAGVGAGGASSIRTSPYRSSLKNLLHRNPKSAADGSMRLPLLRDSDSETLSISSSRFSLSSSSSSGLDHEDNPRLSLDLEKHHSPLRARLVRPRPAAPRAGLSRARRAAEAVPPPRGASVDSPRMNSSGKVVFYDLERSSSSPSNYTASGGGGHRARPPGIERSNVRVAPVLNVPVCSFRGSAKSALVIGLGQLFSPQKKEKDGPAQFGFVSPAGPFQLGPKYTGR